MIRVAATTAYAGASIQPANGMRCIRKNIMPFPMARPLWRVIYSILSEGDSL
jgi:hypothetical protein